MLNFLHTFVINGVNSVNYVGVEVLTVVTMKNTVSLDITPGNLIEVYRRLGATYCLCLQSLRMSGTSKQHLAQLEK
jgi:hypothetical protein